MTKLAKKAVMELAMAQHKWAVKLLKYKDKNPDCMSHISNGEMTNEMAEKYANTSIEKLAEDAYEYSKMRRAIAQTSNFHPAYTSDIKTWLAINREGIHPNTILFCRMIKEIKK